MFGNLAVTLGSALRAARERRAVPAEEVAWVVGIEEAAYLRMEGGAEMPSLLVLCLLCEVLGVSPDELLGFRPAGVAKGAGLH